jgi:hypothetical protein
MDIKVDYAPETGLYHLTFSHARISLSRPELENLTLQAAKHLPGLLPGVDVQEDEDVYRVPLRRLLDLSDRDLQTFLREAQSDDLVKTLWFMDDAALIERVFANLSQRTREMLQGDMRDFAAAHSRLNERAQAHNRAEAIEAAKRLIATLHAVVENGQSTLI